MLKRLGTPYSNEKPGFIMGVSGGGKKYSSRKNESVFKDDNVDDVVICGEDEYIGYRDLPGSDSYVTVLQHSEVLSSSGLFEHKNTGAKVKVLNLVEMEKSGKYNPFAYIRDGYEEDVFILVATLIANTEGGNDPFWENAEKSLLEAIMFYILEVGDENEKNMAMVFELVSLIDVNEDEAEYQNPLDIMFEEFEEDYGSDHIAVEKYKAYKSVSDKMALVIAKTLKTRLAPFNIDTVSNLTNSDNLELGNIGGEKTKLYVIISQENTSLNFIAVMMLTQLFNILNFQSYMVYNCTLPIHINFSLNGLINTNKIPDFEKILAYSRPNNISISGIIKTNIRE